MYLSCIKYRGMLSKIVIPYVSEWKYLPLLVLLERVLALQHCIAHKLYLRFTLCPLWNMASLQFPLLHSPEMPGVQSCAICLALVKRPVEFRVDWFLFSSHSETQRFRRIFKFHAVALFLSHSKVLGCFKTSGIFMFKISACLRPALTRQCLLLCIQVTYAGFQVTLLVAQLLSPSTCGWWPSCAVQPKSSPRELGTFVKPNQQLSSLRMGSI